MIRPKISESRSRTVTARFQEDRSKTINRISPRESKSVVIERPRFSGEPAIQVAQENIAQEGDVEVVQEEFEGGEPTP